MEELKAIWTYLTTTGTNDAVMALVLKNIILLAVIAKVTPWTWDNNLLAWFRNKFMKPTDTK